MKKFSKLFILTLTIVCSMVIFSACKKTSEPKSVKYDIVFMVNEDVYFTIETLGNEQLNLPNAPDVSGYIFEGWYFDEDIWQEPFDKDYFLDKKVTSDIYVYAKLEANSNTNATFNLFSQTGEFEYSLKVTNSTQSLSLSSLVQVDNYGSWALYTDLTGGQIANKIATLDIGNNIYYVRVTAMNGETQDYTLKIRRRPIYTVIFNTNDGTDVEPQMIEEDGFVTTPTTSKVGYTFAGWDFNFSTPITQNITINALWTANQYTITYDADGGDVLHPQTVVIYNENYILEIPTKEGFDFLGWFTANDEKFDNGKWTKTTNIEVKAKWAESAKVFKVTLVTNTLNLENPVIDVIYGEAMPEDVLAPTKVGYIFLGYFAENNAESTQYYTIDMESVRDYDIEGNTTLYAQWQAITYTIKFDANFDGYDPQVNNTMQDQIVTYGIQTNINVNLFTREGYLFNGWKCLYNNRIYADYEQLSSHITTQDGIEIIFQAQWKGQQKTVVLEDRIVSGEYTITFDHNYIQQDRNGNTIRGPKETVVIRNVDDYSLNNANYLSYPEIPTRPTDYVRGYSYQFAGWYTTSTASSGTLFEFGTEITQNMTLYAKWADHYDFTQCINTPILNQGFLTGGGDWFAFVPLGDKSNYITYKGLNGRYDIYVVNMFFEDIGAIRDRYIYKEEYKLYTSTTTGRIDLNNGVLEVGRRYYFLIVPRDSAALQASFDLAFYTTTPTKESKANIKPDENTVVVGESFSLDIPKKTGHVFKGWYDGVGGTGTQLTDENGNGIGVWTITNYRQSVYAKWEKALYKLTFQTNGGEPVLSITQEYQYTLNELPIPTKEGKTFDGWYLNSSFTGSKQTTFTFSSNKTLYAKWIDYAININHSNILAINDTANIMDIATYSATAVDTDGITRDVTVKLISGEFKAGEIITIQLSATGLYDVVKSVTLEIRVYGTPTIEYNTTKDYINLTDTLNGELFNVVAKDSFNIDLTAIVEVKQGQYNAKDIVTIVISATDILGNEKIIEIENIKVYGLPTIIRDEAIDKIKVSDTISNELFNVLAKDSFENVVESIVTSVESGEIEAGNTITIKTIATDAKGNINSITYQVKVYGEPVIQDATTKEFKLTDEISLTTLGIVVLDSFGDKVENVQLKLKQGEIVAGAVVSYTVEATDSVGNVSIKDIENIKIYGNPIITYNIEKLAINEQDEIDANLFGATAKDSFNEDIEVDISVLTGEVKGGTIVTFKLIAIDKLGNEQTEETAEIKVYSSDDITISYDLILTSNIKKTSCGEEWNARATNSFNEICDICIELADGYVLEGGNIVNLYLVATDIMGNIQKSDLIENVNIYDIPTLTYLKDNSSIKDTEKPEDLFVVKDSFGNNIEYSVEIISGSLTEGKIIYKITATDVANNTLIATYELDVINTSTSESILYLYKNGEFVGTQKILKNENYTLPNYNGYESVWCLNEIPLTDAFGNSLKIWDKDSDEYTIETTLTPIVYTIEYDLDKGENANSNSSTYTIESEDIVLEYPTKTGYAFVGWHDEETQATVKDVVISKGSFGNKSYIAIWKANEYTISFDVNGGDNEIEAMKVVFDEEVELPTPTRKGYDFVNWTNEEIVYTDGVWKTEKDITLVANWNARTDTLYTINHYHQNIENDEYTLFESVEDYATTDTEFSAKLNEYEGFTSPKAKNVYILADGSAVADYYYTRNLYTITVVGNGGTNNEITQKYGSKLNMAEWSTRDGWGIDGFYLDIDMRNQFTDETMGVENVTVYAHWLGETFPYELKYVEDTYSSNLKGMQIYGYIGESKILNIPSHIGGVKVTYLYRQTQSSTFATGEINTIIIPDTVDGINNSLFSSVSNIKHIQTSFTGSGVEYNNSLSSIFNTKSLESLVITKATTIYQNSLKDITTLKSVTLPATLLEIQANAFSGCSNLTSITIPSATTTIDGTAFNYCSSLAMIVVDPDNAIYDSRDNCNAIIETATNTLVVGCKSTNIVNSVKAIGDYAFTGSGIIQVYIPASVEIISNLAFVYCSQIESIVVDTPNSVYDSRDNCNAIIKTSSNALISASNNTIIPDSVKILQPQSFSARNITKMVVPDSVKTIYPQIFDGCDNLKSLTIPFIGVMENSTGVYGDGSDLVLDYLYTNNGYNDESIKLEELTITKGNCIYEYAISGCKYLIKVTLPETVTTIKTYAFLNCSALKEITIPNQVTIIQAYTFEGCSSLEKVILPNALEAIGNQAFYDCSALKEINIPSNLKRLNDRAFNGCTSLTSLVIPDTCTYIGVGAFNGCVNLTTISVPFVGNYQTSSIDTQLQLASIYSQGSTSVPFKKVTITGETTLTTNAFKGLSALEELVVSKYLTTIQSNALTPCVNLKSLTIPFIGSSTTSTTGRYLGYLFGASSATGQNNYIPATLSSITVTNQALIATNMFLDCVNLKEISITNPNADVSKAFVGCTSLQSLTVPSIGYKPEGQLFLGYFFGATSYSQNSLKVPSSLKTLTITNQEHLDDYAVYHVTSLTTVNIGDATKSIGRSVFYNCTNLKTVAFSSNLETIGQYAFDSTHLTSVTLPNGLLRIEDGAFENNYYLTKIVIPDSVEFIGKKVLQSCHALKYVTVPFLGETIDVEVNGVGYLFNDLDEDEYDNSSPWIIFKLTITKDNDVGAHAFDGAMIEHIELPTTVTSIGENAFSNSDYLISIKTPFVGATATTNNYLGYFFGATSYQDNASSLSSKMLSIYLTNCENIADYQFYGCSQLITISLPSNLKTIGKNAFENCSKITEINIPEGVTSVGKDAFKNCTSLTKTIGASVDAWLGIQFASTYSNPIYYSHNLYIGEEEINELIIPEEITTISNSAFYNCESLTSIFIPNTITKIGKWAFENCINVQTITFEENSIIEIIDDSAFRQCSSITEIVIPNTVTYLGDYMFHSCSKLANVTLSPNITFIGVDMFEFCNSLKEITIPSSVTEIRTNAFYGCNYLKTVTFEEKSQLKAIGNKAFYNNHSLKITIPSSVISIGESAFANYAGVLGVQSIKFETNSQLQSIGKEAFYNSVCLTEIVIPKTVITISADAFKNCNNLTIYCEQDSIPSTWDTTWNSANRPVYLYSESQPIQEGKYWHYVNNEIVIW